ncbi:exodeoxyribonuclease VII large subunit [Georgenia sp. TF02-10]|uniref:exodeoxyribonuclease VII large subunit n=1 Tax=Georgenia sp. TF02-10 TaxID=2917725 RepID=UPI001FA716AC|nr:exodeoxyribonuclease VII large subunit [Georgenia sp. TF02-10]UNX55636.1 exodeoxyribonuclease VII large subunit [Georgenia sp. TF02-10]
MISPAPAAPRRLADKALETTAENPWPVRLLSAKIAGYVDRMAPVWVEGQVVQLNRRPGASLAFLTLRDAVADMSLPVAVQPRVLGRVDVPLAEGAHVVVHAKPVFWPKRGTLQLEADELRPVGVGELLARIEQLKRVLAAEGLFDADRKRPLPFLPRRVGLVCGRESKAEHDVVVNARARWPALAFTVREVAVQGAAAVAEVSAAIAELDDDPDVDVIVVARGGGGVEDLLPFSNEALVRAAAACRTPLVSAIGHETDTPLLDLVADYRASTPTAAARRVVPDVAEERAALARARGRLRAALTGLTTAEQHRLDAVRSRPCLADPTTLVTRRAEDVARLRSAARQGFTWRTERAGAELTAVHGRLRALSPAATLARGYAVLRTRDQTVVRSSAEVVPGDRLEALLAAGRLGVEVRAAAPPDGPGGTAATGRAAGRPSPADLEH